MPYIYPGMDFRWGHQRSAWFFMVDDTSSLPNGKTKDGTRTPGVSGDLTRGEKVARCDESDRFLIHARALASLVEYGHSQGMAEDVIAHELAMLGLGDVRLDAFDSFISMNRFAKLIRRFGRLLGNEAIGLDAANPLHFSSLGAFGNAVISAPNLDAALQVLCRYMRLYADVSFASTTVGEEHVSFEWAYSPLIVARDVMCDRAARMFLTHMRDLFGPNWAPVQVALQRPRPTDLRPYRNALCADVGFDAPLNRIVLRRSDLDLPNVRADRHAHEVAVALADRMMAERRIPDDLSIRAREDIMHHLVDEGPNINETARRLGVSPRSLQRRLDELGTNYQRLSDEARQRLAEEFLVQTRLPMGEIAYRLGFANQANLTRACKRWFGASPRQVRATAD
jgi:AraC-like DNA-binding protein